MTYPALHAVELDQGELKLARQVLDLLQRLSPEMRAWILARLADHVAATAGDAGE